jgi:hypothetical protein
VVLAAGAVAIVLLTRVGRWSADAGELQHRRDRPRGRPGSSRRRVVMSLAILLARFSRSMSIWQA